MWFMELKIYTSITKATQILQTHKLLSNDSKIYCWNDQMITFDISMYNSSAMQVVQPFEDMMEHYCVVVENAFHFI